MKATVNRLAGGSNPSRGTKFLKAKSMKNGTRYCIKTFNVLEQVLFSMVWIRSQVCFYNRNGTYYFSRAVPSDLRNRFPKRKIEVSLRTKSESKAARSAAALSDRLERYWNSLRMEMIYSKELSLTVLPEARTVVADSFSFTDALALYH